MLPDARQAWLDAQQAGWGDPARLHRPGRLAAQALDQAREGFEAMIAGETRLPTLLTTNAPTTDPTPSAAASDPKAPEPRP